MNLAATVPGWSRWAPAEEMLRKVRQDTVADAATSGAATGTQEQREALFREFLQWQQRQRARQGFR